MFCVENNSITITKGDSGRINLKFLNKDGTEYVPNDGDEVLFSVKRRAESFCPIVFEKEGTTIALSSEETQKMPSGEYVYDVVIKKSTGERYTAIQGKLQIRKAVHDFE